MERIYENIISNSIKFSPYNKNVYITISEKNGFIIVSVKDEGPGFSNEDKKHLFKKFAKLSAQPTGGETTSGLGLSIVKMLTEAMQGRVYCISEPGQGAEFIIEFPIMK